MKAIEIRIHKNDKYNHTENVEHARDIYTLVP